MNDIQARDVTIKTADAYPLQATLYDAGSSDAMLIGGAMGVRRRYYDAFARHVAERGRSVLTFDYRGIGDFRPASLRGFDATMEQWGLLDIPAAIDWIARDLAPASLVYTGHSAGGQLIGLAPNVERIDKFVLSCSQSGWWGYWPAPFKFALAALWHTMPAISAMFGYFPARRAGIGGEDLPRGVATQWARWGQQRDYLFRDHPHAHSRITKPMLAWSLRDDRYAPRPAVEALLHRYANARITHVHVEERGLGHFDFFRKQSMQYWDASLDWIAVKRDPDTPLSTEAAASHRDPATA